MIFGIWCGLVRSSSDLLKDWIFDWSVHHPLMAIYAIVILPIPIYMIMLFCQLRSTRSCDFVDRDLRDHVILVGPSFEPRAKQCNFFIDPGFDSQARLPVSGQCDSWPMSLWGTVNGHKKYCLIKSTWMACELAFVFDWHRTVHDGAHWMVCDVRWRSCNE